MARSTKRSGDVAAIDPKALLTSMNVEEIEQQIADLNREIEAFVQSRRDVMSGLKIMLKAARTAQGLEAKPERSGGTRRVRIGDVIKKQLEHTGSRTLKELMGDLKAGGATSVTRDEVKRSLEGMKVRGTVETDGEDNWWVKQS